MNTYLSIISKSQKSQIGYTIAAVIFVMGSLLLLTAGKCKKNRITAPEDSLKVTVSFNTMGETK